MPGLYLHAGCGSIVHSEDCGNFLSAVECRVSATPMVGSKVRSLDMQ